MVEQLYREDCLLKISKLSNLYEDKVNQIQKLGSECIEIVKTRNKYETYAKSRGWIE